MAWGAQFTARNNMKAMQLGELAFFYHSNIGKEIVGIMKVVKLAHPDSTAEPTTMARSSGNASMSSPTPGCRSR